ncbi:TetR/AcrR family transcriptional regulator [Luteimonas sp. BDR2-5]|uniref:TetR/AcrR family transcriptional regulator n=1 Tax=Proluteimonas luteida TaxID=2878685 RepID=UPI001E40537B|nr:TetR/AcrR family transcriptional regulator [Luteimonas sp. BDR2-5]MCD9026967.1 TetR/AcrR family transcriptional regulator [Luteimonas sp. BDR2-5]
MPTSPSASKGATTREAILDRAYALACVHGLEGLTIGSLAGQVGMSKSGVFAHFGSREDLQLAVLDHAGQRFVGQVMLPALKARRGLPRLRAIFSAWLDWVRHDEDGGCLFLAAASEYDDRPGPQRDRLVAHETRWRQELARAIGLAIDSGELLPGTDPEQVAFEIYGLMLAVHHDAGLFGYEASAERARTAFARLIDAASRAHPG